jgi:ferritin-like metal-binding protein YciE
VAHVSPEKAMPRVDHFHDLYVSELQELRSVEDQLLAALPGLAEMAASVELQATIGAQLGVTRLQRDRLDSLLQEHGAEPRAHRDESMLGLISEADRWARMVDAPDLRDACLIGSVQRIGHYQIAVYGTLASWAKQTGQEDDLAVLRTGLDQEKRADDVFSKLAKSIVNPVAAQA